ncbi:hypothetical protein C5748_04865 [Phyllobacterium phragmitis]|uniref:C4-dicarboxylate transport sensor protein DctB n=1 Tax=Phyllobacterium phragmitis TaxID=2670329 RepID=A0A2S9IW27_9HYPH|nr:ATP-binding protein [Phyllobacterium phragmitis]PRD44731.1 hypothetical protein C5748_04865 [Phyllobacterium phragmitis]
MISGHKIRSRFRIARVAAAIAVALISVAAIYVVSTYWRDRADVQIRRKAAETLAVQAEILAGMLDKYRVLPPLLSRQDDIAALFPETGLTPDLIGKARRKAEEVTGLSGAKEVAFFLPDGRLLASARRVFDDDPAGRRALIEAARQGQLGRAVVSLDNRERGYAFSSGVRRRGAMIGVVVVYVGFDSVEATWSLSANPIFVSDRSGTVFLTNRSEWKLRPVSAIAEEASGTQRFRAGNDYVAHIDLSRDLPLLDWQLHVLADRKPLEEARLFGALAAALACLVLATAVFLLIRRRETAVLKLRKDRAAALRLERMVRDRTLALSRTNVSLSREIEERRLAEDKLRKTQTELVQAAKLAALGQMSATLSHEFNQPLAAIRTYADNGARLLSKGCSEQATDNFSRIAAMVDRMAELSRALLSFSRKSGTTTGIVPLAAVLDEALILVRPRARKAHVAIELDPALRTLSVLGGRIRLSQVFVNLVNNAIDAMAGQDDGVVRITLASLSDELTINVSDSGPGIDKAHRAFIFEPFFTTKQAGEGIGIGLSIAYNIVREFGGQIVLHDQEEGNCTFAITLKLAEAHGIAAE